MNDLQAFLQKIADKSSLVFQNEEATKLGVILPILRRLGWDTEDMHEVWPEFKVGAGTDRVDFRLIAGGTSVLLEAKKIEEDLERHHRQLLKYAFEEDARIAVLTNGQTWWFYLPRGDGAWEQRKFFTIDILQQGDQAAENFEKFLGRDEVCSGRAVSLAEQTHRNRHTNATTRRYVGEAFRQLCQEPAAELIDLLSDRIEALSGRAPNRQIVETFLSGTSKPAREPSNPTEAPTTPEEEPARKANVKERRSRYTGHQVEAFSLFGQRHPADSFKDVLVQVCQILATRSPNEFRNTLKLSGRTRSYFATTSEGMTRGVAIPGTGIYAEANLSSTDCVRNAKMALEAAGFSRDDLKVHLSGQV